MSPILKPLTQPQLDSLSNWLKSKDADLLSEWLTSQITLAQVELAESVRKHATDDASEGFSVEQCNLRANMVRYRIAESVMLEFLTAVFNSKDAPVELVDRIEPK